MPGTIIPRRHDHAKRELELRARPREPSHTYEISRNAPKVVCSEDRLRSLSFHHESERLQDTHLCHSRHLAVGLIPPGGTLARRMKRHRRFLSPAGKNKLRHNATGSPRAMRAKT